MPGRKNRARITLHTVRFLRLKQNFKLTRNSEAFEENRLPVTGYRHDNDHREAESYFSRCQMRVQTNVHVRSLRSLRSSDTPMTAAVFLSAVPFFSFAFIPSLSAGIFIHRNPVYANHLSLRFSNYSNVI